MQFTMKSKEKKKDLNSNEDTMAYNAANRKDVREAEKRAKLEELQRREIVVHLMDTMAGRKWILDILETCHIFQTSFTPHSGQTAFREGERNIGLRILMDVMDACPDQYVLMMRERNERNASRDAADNTRHTRDPNASDGSGEYARSEGAGRDTEGPGEDSDFFDDPERWVPYDEGTGDRATEGAK
jgi:hypothetical protein